MRRSAIGCKSGDSGKESRQWIHVLDRRIRAEGEACTVFDNVAESVQQFHTFLTLQRVSVGQVMRVTDKPGDLRQSTCHLF